MASKKNFTMKEYNGTDYDTLYPETNSGQVLLDNTAQTELGLAGGGQTPPTLDDALGKLNNFDNRYEIGDVLTTSRTNLSDKWLLCNGDNVLEINYPELASQFIEANLQFDKIATQSVTSNKYKAYSIATRRIDSSYDGLLMYIFDSADSNGDGLLYYKDTRTSSSWVQLTKPYSNYSFNCYSVVKCLNNHFIFFNTRANGLSNACAYYEGTPTSSNYKMLSILSDVATEDHWKDAVCYNNKYYFLINGTYASYLYVYNELSSTPTKIPLQLSSNETLRDTIGIVNDKICISYSVYSSSSGDAYATGIILVDENNNITKQLLENQGITIHGGAHTFNDFNGKCVDIIQYSGYSSGYRYWHIYVAPSIFGQFTKMTDITYTWPTTIYQVHKPWIVSSDKLLFFNKKYINLNFEMVDWDNASSISQTYCFSFSDTDKYIYTMCPQYEVWSSDLRATFNLPTYSPATGLRAYIKAKN